jgi:hypothetical protein
MPATYTLIASNTLSSSAASVTFSAIPGTYTDLVVRLSARKDSAFDQPYFLITLNTGTSSLHSYTSIYGDGTNAATEASTNTANVVARSGVTKSTDTSNTFGSAEIYIPSYTTSQNKPLAAWGATENNATAANIGATAGLLRSTSAITQINIAPNSGNFVSGSSFFLYGIKNS